MPASTLVPGTPLPSFRGHTKQGPQRRGSRLAGNLDPTTRFVLVKPRPQKNTFRDNLKGVEQCEPDQARPGHAMSLIRFII
jgi:hypothetical protein